MNWILLSVLAAFGQALVWALKKRALENLGVNNTLGLVSYGCASLAFLTIFLLFEHREVHASSKFFLSVSVLVTLNVLAVWASYRALDRAALSTLMPYMALTALFIPPIEYVLRGTFPSVLQATGMVIVSIGAIVFARSQPLTSGWIHTAKYFGVTLLCYSITSPLAGVAVAESGSGIFTALIVHVGITLGFIPLVLVTQESGAIKQLRDSGILKRVLLVMASAGLVSAFLENGPINLALEVASASEIFALKRLMPFFALILGIVMFGERVKRQHVLGTTLLVFGSFLVIWYR